MQSIGAFKLKPRSLYSARTDQIHYIQVLFVSLLPVFFDCPRTNIIRLHQCFQYLQHRDPNPPRLREMYRNSTHDFTGQKVVSKERKYFNGEYFIYIYVFINLCILFCLYYTNVENKNFSRLLRKVVRGPLVDSNPQFDNP